MARILRDQRIDTRNARLKLIVRAEPHWMKLAKGCYLGYRKTERGNGTWIARYRDRTRKQHYKSIGAADDLFDADGDTALSFEQAQKKARDWLQNDISAEINGRRLGVYTVADCMKDYLAYIQQRRKSHAHLDTYISAYILPRLGRVNTAELTTPIIRSWHEAIAAEPPRLRSGKGKAVRYRDEDPDPKEAQRKRRLRANRHLTTLKAALNRAWRDGLIPHRDAWERVEPFKGVERQRTKFLTVPEAQHLLAHTAEDMRKLVLAALLTGARYSELANLDVRDFERVAKTLLIRDSKSGKARRIYLNKEAVAFFGSLAVGRHLMAPLIVRSDGSRWARDLHFRGFKAALAAAGLDTSFTFHELRHTWASLTIMAGAPLMVVAQNLGHRDTRMVEEHYGHLANGFVRSVIEEKAPTFGAGLMLQSRFNAADGLKSYQ
ncbi:site-specific integrase [Ferrovibrio sp.]|uniref:tyrosine-type recombinase/integrase n=1 Tax=Ferrovibrio sp. TaxID=1917215 RepID=UPI001B4D3038|nr:site-specific integrase [Ferrovibrio sp.]MBP7063435.1 site-specific integrase [Ferrovibrio sp.]